MTTVASGRCTSAPVSVASAIGTKPRGPTSAVMMTGRNRVSALTQMECSSSKGAQVVTDLWPVETQSFDDGDATNYMQSTISWRVANAGRIRRHH
jgi:hypothetical protein